MTYIVNKNIQPARSRVERADEIGNAIAAVILFVVAAGVFAFCVVAAYDPALLIDLPQ